jgi:Zn finger protein HypA/HybF involved in hydrogenase expression
MAMMQITYQITIGEGRTLAFEIGEDTDIGPEALNKTLDLVAQATARQKAEYDLPFQEQQLIQCRETLEATRKRRAQAAATLDAHVAQLSATRRSNVQPLQSDVNAVAEFDKTITNLEAAIKANELLIPRLKAIIAGQPLPSLLDEAAPEEFAVPVPMAAD